MSLTLSPAPVHLYDGTSLPWYRVDVDSGHRLRGTVRALFHYPDELTVDLSPHELDAEGRTLYRTADPDADEVQVGMAVLVKPLRANRVAVDGTMRATYRDGAWKIDYAGTNPYVAGSAFAPVSDSAYRLCSDLVVEIGEAMRTNPEIMREAELRDATTRLMRAREDRDKAAEILAGAETALAAAQARMAEVMAR